MNTTDILTQARAASATANSGQETAGTCLANDFSPTVESMTLEELDIGGSEFSWSSVGSGPSQPSPDAHAATIEGTSGEGVAVAKETPPLNQLTSSTGTPAKHASAPSTPKHLLYFWDSITFKVEGIVFQLPKYRFVEESEVFMAMATGNKADEPIELDVGLGDFEGFLKVFLPRASAMYDERPTLTKDEWISVLKLSTKWLFNDLRELAITYLSWHWRVPTLDPIERICLAKEYRVYDWLLQGYEQVIERLLTSDNPDGSPTTLTKQDGKRIGMDVALELSGIAIRRMRLAERLDLMDVESDVLDMFKQEFDCVQEEGAQFMTRAERLEEGRKKEEEEVKQRTEQEDEQKASEEAARLAAEQEAESKRLADIETQRLTDEIKAKRLAAIEAQLFADIEGKRLADEIEAKRLAGEIEAKQLAVEIEAKRLAEDEAKRRVMEDTTAQRVLKEEAEKELKRQGEGARDKGQVVEPDRLETAEELAPSPKRMSKKEKKYMAARKQKQLEEERTRLLAVEHEKGLADEEEKLSKGDDMGRLGNEDAKRLEKEELNRLKEETANRLKEEEELEWQGHKKRIEYKKDNKMQAPAEEEIRMRKGGVEGETKSLAEFGESTRKFKSWFG